jgi:hypothetical protein
MSAPQPRKGDELDAIIESYGININVGAHKQLKKDVEALCRKRELLARKDERQHIEAEIEDVATRNKKNPDLTPLSELRDYMIDSKCYIQAELDKGDSDD